MLSVGADPVGERRLLSGELACPACGRRLAPWGHAAPRFVRVTAELVRRIRPRRAICSSAAGCGRSHVLLPRFCLGRRVDVVAVIWAALLARAGGRGWRAITAAAGRPASTVRGWLSRFAAHAEPIRAAFARLERQVEHRRGHGPPGAGRERGGGRGRAGRRGVRGGAPRAGSRGVHGVGARRWWRPVRAAGCWRPGHQRPTGSGSTRPRICKRSCRRATVVGVAVAESVG